MEAIYDRVDGSPMNRSEIEPGLPLHQASIRALSYLVKVAAICKLGYTLYTYFLFVTNGVDNNFLFAEPSLD